MNRADKMLEYFDGGKHWYQGGYQNEAGTKSCLMGANMLISQSEDSGEYFELHNLMGKVIKEQYPDRINPEPDSKMVAFVPAFNDHPDTNWEDIRAVLEKVSTKLDEVV